AVEHANSGTVLATSTWGTERIPAPDLLEAMLQQRPIKVDDQVVVVVDGERRTRQVPNLSETEAAQAKAEALAERFSEWVWEDPERTARLTRIYNDRFNAIVLRSYDDAEPRLPGVAVTFKNMVRPHQK